MSSQDHRIEPLEPAEIELYVRFENDDVTKPRVSMLSYFDEQVDQIAGLELRLDRGVEYRLVFSIIGRNTIRFNPGSVSWTDTQDPALKSAPAPTAVRSTFVTDGGKTLELVWKGDDETPYVNMFTVSVSDPAAAALVQGILDPTIVNKPPE